MRTVYHKVDFCVVGGGLAGICAALAAARRGVATILMHDRPVLGGNASSEVRMWICGAHGRNCLETGIIEEIRLENLYRNNYPNYSVWDSILYGKVKFQENLTVLLNCSCNEAEMEAGRIKSVSGWQLTSETRHVVEAELFTDCSGDSILAPLCGAEFRYGREAAAEFNEAIEPENADSKTMGMSCLIQARETDSPKKFIPPEWAAKYTEEDFANRPHSLAGLQNFWWLETGGLRDTVHDCEDIRDELVKMAFGVWDHIKNGGDHGAENWCLDWIGFLPGKRESRRMSGDYIITQNDVETGGKFHDIVAYGGWSMDDHHPEGFKYPGEPTIFHPAPSPYGIPYRALYSKNIANLFFAGRNISATHAAMSSTRVMATCALLGQAVGTAATIAVNHKLSPRGVYLENIQDLQTALMDDDIWLPGLRRPVPELSVNSALNTSSGNPEPLRNGLDRPIDGDDNCWSGKVNDYVEYSFTKAERISCIRIVFDSDLNRGILNMVSYYPKDLPEFSPPDTLIAGFKLEIADEYGKLQEVFRSDNNYQRLFRFKLDVVTTKVRLTILRIRGAGHKNVYAFDVR